MNHIEVYYDGVNIDKFYDNPNVKGFTTNISFLKAAGISDYHSFITNSLKYIQGRPISFQLYDDLDEDIESTAKIISSYDKEHIFVKIPVIKTNTESNANIIQKLHNESIKINVTAIFTKEQIDSIRTCFDKTTDVIVSIFAGRINDSGLDCSDVVKHAVETFKDYPNIKILWAACRTVYNMFEAENQGAHIVTVPDTVLSRMNRIGDDTHEASVQQVKQFMKDGIDGNITFPPLKGACPISNIHLSNTENKRYIFISASKLQKFWKNVPKDILDNSLFFFGSKRHWLFPNSYEEMEDSKKQTTDYLSFDKDLLYIIKEKEQRNEVFYLYQRIFESAPQRDDLFKYVTGNLVDESTRARIEFFNGVKSKDTEHAGDYNAVSKWFIENGYNPLWLSDEIWEEKINYVKEKQYFGVSIDQIKYNYNTGNHFYNEVMALIKYSNENLYPIIEMFVPPDFIINLNIPNLNLHPLKYVFEQLKLEKQENELWLEFGVFNGNSINYISKFTSDIVYGFDSFEGLPEDWRENHLKGEFKINDLPNVNNNVTLIKGWFNDTVEEFMNIHKDKQISFLHLDADLYSSTKYVLDTLKHNIKNGCIIIFDELVNYKGFDGEKGELRALYEFIQENNINYEYIGMDGIVNLKGSEYHIPNKTCVAIQIMNIIRNE